MINLGKKDILGIRIDALDYEATTNRILECAQERRSCTVTALAVHGLVTGSLDPSHRFRLNAFDLIVPDGQPVRWALNLLHGTNLRDRVYGPKLTLQVCREAANRSVPVYFYGSRETVLQRLCYRMKALHPGLQIAGAQPSQFRQLTREELNVLVKQITDSGAKILFVGLGCPRQEVFAYEMSAHLHMPILAVGAAFDYHSGLLKEPPELMQRAGLQWVYRLGQEPRRLWRRYLFTNSQFVVLLLLQLLRLRSTSLAKTEPPNEMLYG